MAKNPKIEFYTLKLNPIRENEVTFGELFQKEYLDQRAENGISNDDIIPADEDLMIDFFRYFFLKIDLGVVRNNAKRKAFIAKRHIGDAEINNTIFLQSEHNIIHGRIKGGEFDTGKYLNEIDNPDEDSQPLNASHLITDDFYFLLYTPLDKSVGVLILQSYTKDNISDIFRPFIENLFKRRYQTNKATSSLFMPYEMQRDFKNNSIVKSFLFKNRFVVSEVHEQTLQEGDFTISVEIKSNGNQVNLNNLPRWRRILGEAILRVPSQEQRTLDTFTTQRGYIQDPEITSNPTKFSLDDNNLEIKATIYLANYINLEENGVPIWQELEAFAIQTLNEEVKPEIYPEDYLNDDED